MSSGCPQGARNPFLKVHEDSAQCISVHSPATSRIQTTSAAVLGIAHTNNGTGDAVNRVLGSVAYVNAARSVLILGRPPDGEDGPDRIVVIETKPREQIWIARLDLPRPRSP